MQAAVIAVGAGIIALSVAMAAARLWDWMGWPW
jgi:hypothetical protein